MRGARAEKQDKYVSEASTLLRILVCCRLLIPTDERKIAVEEESGSSDGGRMCP